MQKRLICLKQKQQFMILDLITFCFGFEISNLEMYEYTM